MIAEKAFKRGGFDYVSPQLVSYYSFRTQTGTLFTQGAQAALSRMRKRNDRLIRWASKVRERRGKALLAWLSAQVSKLISLLGLELKP